MLREKADYEIMTSKIALVELVGIEPFQWIENIQLADSTMSSNGRKGTNSNSAVQNGTRTISSAHE